MGAAAFGIASVLAAFSTSAGMLIAIRAPLGLAGATLAPSTLSLIRNMFLDSHQRTVAIGVWISSYWCSGCRRCARASGRCPLPLRSSSAPR